MLDVYSIMEKNTFFLTAKITHNRDTQLYRDKNEEN